MFVNLQSAVVSSRQTGNSEPSNSALQMQQLTIPRSGPSCREYAVMHVQKGHDDGGCMKPSLRPRVVSARAMLSAIDKHERQYGLQHRCSCPMKRTSVHAGSCALQPAHSCLYMRTAGSGLLAKLMCWCIHAIKVSWSVGMQAAVAVTHQSSASPCSICQYYPRGYALTDC